MKSLFFVLAGAVMIMLSACGGGGSSNDLGPADTISQKLNLVIGSWYFTNDTVRYYNNGNLDSTKSFFYFNSDKIVFNAQGTGTETRSNIAYNFSFSIVSPVIDLDFTTKPPATQGIKLQTDGIGGSSLVATGYNVFATIKQVSSTNMVLVFQTTVGTQQTDEMAYFSK